VPEEGNVTKSAKKRCKTKRKKARLPEGGNAGDRLEAEGKLPATASLKFIEKSEFLADLNAAV